jgi:uncharacterized SAM-binding protein YcdF (DUF218 family)
MGASALVALGSSRQGRDGIYRITPACKRVVAYAARLAERPRADLIVFSGWAPDGSDSEAMQMWMLWPGDPGNVVLEETASTTAENAARTLSIVRDHGIGHVTVVCTPLHVYRARWFFRRLYAPHGIETRFEVPRIAPTPSSLAWELGALTVRGRQLRAVEEELQGRPSSDE